MTSAMRKLIVLKVACCGTPLLVLGLIASGAVAAVDLAIGSAVLGLALIVWVLWRRRPSRVCKARNTPAGAQPSDSSGAREAADR